MSEPLLANGEVIMWLGIVDQDRTAPFFAKDRGLSGLDPWTIHLDPQTTTVTHQSSIDYT